jgi:hypothetical protein
MATANTYTVGQNQSIWDIAIELTGSVEGLFDLLDANNQDLDWVPAAGDVIYVPDVVYDADTLAVFAAQGVEGIVNGRYTEA